MNFPIHYRISYLVSYFCAKSICRVCETYLSIYIENSRIWEVWLSSPRREASYFEGVIAYTLFCMVLCGFTAAIIRRIVEERREIKGVVCEVTVFSTITLPHFWGDNVRGGNIYLTIYVLKPSDRNGSTQSQRTNRNLGAFRRGKCGPACASIIVDITCVSQKIK